MVETLYITLQKYKNNFFLSLKNLQEGYFYLEFLERGREWKIEKLELNFN